MKLTGIEAIEYAEQHGLTLSKYTDPTEDAREWLSVADARAVAAQDPSLICLHTVICPLCRLPVVEHAVHMCRGQ